MVASKISPLPPLFKMMLAETADKLSVKIEKCLHNSTFPTSFATVKSNRRKHTVAAANTGVESNRNKRGAGCKGSAAAASSKLSKLIPPLVFQMEQLDLQLIKLSAAVATEKAFISKLIKRSQIRDFKITKK